MHWEIIKNLIAIAVHLSKPFHQLVVLTIFLNGILDEDVFMKQPQSFVKPGEGHLICKLHKISIQFTSKSSSLVCLFSCCTFCLGSHLIKFRSNWNLYIAHVATSTVVLIIYVDDIFVTGNDSSLITQLKNYLHQTSETNDLGPIQQYLGIQFGRDSSGSRMHQTKYALSILHQFGMDDYAPSHTPLLKSLTTSKACTPCVDATI